MKAPLSNQILVQQSQFWRRLLPLLALFVAFGTSFQARAQRASITGSNITVNPGSGNEIYGGKTGTPLFQGADLGTFNVSNFNTTLFLKGGTLVTVDDGGEKINSASLSYRVTKITPSTQDGPLKSFDLPLSNTNGAEKTFSTNVQMANLLMGLSGTGSLEAGNYAVEVFLTAVGTRANGNLRILNDPNGDDADSYRATFTVEGVRPLEPSTSTTWTGGKNDNWFDPINWSNGIPAAGKDATIPDFGSGSAVQYPNIYSDAIKADVTTRTRTNPGSLTDTATVLTTIIGYDNTASGPRGASGPAETRTFTMSGTSQAMRSIARLVVGRLNVYGDFNNQQGSFIQREGAVIAFAGGNQVISGSATGFSDVEIRGGGVKDLTTNFAIRAGGTLTFFDGILQTNISNINVSFVTLTAGTGVGSNAVPGGRIVGETETSYLRGYVTTRVAALTGQTQDFGNIGLSLTFTGSNEPGFVLVTRNTAENYATVTGPGTKPTIRRIFGVQPDNASTNERVLNATMTFRYLDNELTGLSDGNQTLDESKLALFVSSSAGNLFGQLGRDALNTTANVLTKFNVTTFATFSLSEATVPLPVTLTAFNAKRVGTNAEITWETVTELNSRGYEVQVSNDGRNYRKLTFVASTSPNSNQLVRYRYTDTEAGKTGVRYYRLRQIDLDGTDYYYAPKAVTFDGAAELGKAEVRAFPNPFGEVLTLMANTSVAGPAQLSVTDMTGRVVGQQTVQLTAGNNDVSVPNVANLRSGIYLVRLVMPSGEAKVLRVSKQ